MVTITINITTLVIGWFIGFCMGAVVILWSELREGGAWSKGFSDGFELKNWLRENGMYPNKETHNDKR